MADPATIPVDDTPIPPSLRAQAGCRSHSVEVVRPVTSSTVDACIAAVETLIATKANQTTLDADMARLSRRALVLAIALSS